MTSTSINQPRSFLNSKWQQILADNHLKTFDDFWQLPIDFVDSGNEGRGNKGWSKVGIADIDSHGKQLRIVVKRQQNYFSRSWQHPLRGTLTFKKEFNWLRHCEKSNIGVPMVVYFAERQQGRNRQAILVTAWLDHYRSLENLMAEWLHTPPTRQLRTAVIHALADVLARFHTCGLEHRCLYPKHVFIDCASEPPHCALIDLEKARLSPWRVNRVYRDLSQLVRYLPEARRTDRVCFIRSYLGQNRLGKRGKALWHAIDAQGRHKTNRHHGH